MDNAYNMKILEYADGTVQIKIYDGVIRPKRKKSKPILRNKSSETSKPMVYKATIEELIEMALKTEEEQRKRAENSLRSSVSRTRANIEMWARSGEFSHFVTLTYDPKKIDRYDYDECIKKFTVWLQNIKRVAPNLQALFVPEFHTKNARIDDNGEEVYAIHFHGLIGHIEGMELEFHKMRNGQKVYSLKNWHFGISDCTEIVNRDAICKYIRKYVTKQTISIARAHKSRHRYFKVGLTRPKEKKMLCEGKYAENLQKEYIENYAEKNGLEVVRSMTEFSQYGYIPVKYTELKQKDIQ